MSAPKLLMHACCGPCFIAPYERLSGMDMEISAYWYNPNIHPYTEYQKRLETLKAFCEAKSIPLIIEDDYDLKGFLLNTVTLDEARCDFCYRTRLKHTAQAAKENGFDYMSSTLLYSRYQNHERINAYGKAYAEEYGVKWYYEDFRELWQHGIELSKAEGMYRQQYCGCIFSERDRYLKQPKKS